jgi:hypothetical protein
VAGTGSIEGFGLGGGVESKATHHLLAGRWDMLEVAADRKQPYTPQNAPQRSLVLYVPCPRPWLSLYLPLYPTPPALAGYSNDPSSPARRFLARPS